MFYEFFKVQKHEILQHLFYIVCLSISETYEKYKFK